MTDTTKLERRYRRLLAWYPAAFRREHEREMLSVLMAGATEGQRRPRLTESANLVRNALALRLRHSRSPGPSRHPRVVATIRVGVGIWLLVLGTILYVSGYPWGVLMVLPAALHFYLAYRVGHNGIRT